MEPPAELARPDDPDREAAVVDDVLRRGSVRSVLQPIVELGTGEPAAYEALARGPADHPLSAPDALLAAAGRAGRLAEIDALCVHRAVEAAQLAGLRPPTALFVNVEPTAGTPGRLPEPPVLTSLHAQGVPVVAELTERALAHDPGLLVVFARRMRTWGCGIALDDVGARLSSLALIPLLRPDVVKLDLRVVQELPDSLTAHTMTAVTAFAEEHGAVVVAEGVETEEHESIARSLGATHAQGWRYGRPTDPEDGVRAGSPSFPVLPSISPPATSPESGYAHARRDRTARTGTKRLLLEVSRLLECRAIEMGELAVVIVTVQDDGRLGPGVRARLARIAEHAAFVVALGTGLSAEPAPGVRGVDIPRNDPLSWEWDLVVVGPHFAAVLAARDRGDAGPDLDRRFDYVLTYDRPTVLDTARVLLSRLGAG